VSVTRRELILGVAAALGFDPPGVLRSPGGRAHAAATASAQLAPEPAAAVLSRLHLEDLVAFAEVLVGDGPLSPVEREYLVDHVERRTTQGGGYYLELYRTTAGLLDSLAGARFSSLDLAQRGALITRHRLFSSAVRPEENLGPFPKETREVRTRAVPDLIGGYYASPAGWAVVGYGAFPGKCGDLARYTSPER